MMQLTRITGLTFIGVLFSIWGFAQSIKGAVKDSSGKAVPFATVNLKNIAGNAILAYVVTDSQGAYLLKAPIGIAADDLMIEVRSIGFKTQLKNIAGFDTPVDFTLVDMVNELKDIVIKSSRPFLRTHGDTLGYSVSDFSGPQDRVIVDVIKKLPGISVDMDGRISYNNKPVSGVYIGGDNLLDDKYNIATNTIPQGVVDQVQVIENHQPIKVLQNRVMSDDVALNLNFKKNAKLQLVGQESISAGLPGKYDVNLNAMLFKDNYKAINYLKGNNTGDDVQQDLVSHNYADYNQRIDNAVSAKVLSTGAVNDPQLSRDRYWFNQSGILNLNNLINLKKNVQLKVNAYYLHDNQLRDYSRQTTIFLPGDTIKYNERQDNRSRPDILHSQFTLNINKDKYYLNNALLMDYNHVTNYSGLDMNGTLVNQVFRDNTQNFSNESNLIKSLKSNNIIQAYSYISHSAEPENRVINPGYNSAIFNNGVPYAQLLQNVNIRTWYTNNYLSFKIPSELITQSFKTGFNVQSQTLASNLGIVQNNGSTSLESDSTINRVSWIKKKLYAEAAYDLLGKNFKVNLTLPITLQQINYSDSLHALKKGLTRLNFNPQLRVKYQTGIENYITFLYSYRNEMGTVQDVYQGYILKDYRTLYANNADLTQRQNQLVSVGFNYRKALTLFFWSINALYNRIRANNIASSVITNNIQQGIVLPFPNSTNSWTLNSSISKYFFVFHTTFSGAMQWQSNSSVQIQNNALLPFKTTSQMLNVSTDTKVSDQVNFGYKATLTQTDSHSSEAASAYHIDQLQQQASVNYNPIADLQFKLSVEHYFIRQQGNSDLKYFFADASVKFRISKWKTDLELKTTNFLDLKTYNALYLSANALMASSYTLPGRIILLKAMFNI